MAHLSDRLHDWESIETDFLDGGLLVGNGASRAVFRDFAYRSLYETAASSELDHSLTTRDKALFAAFNNTKNFEDVLEGLANALVVGETLKEDMTKVRRRYESIQRALVEAVAKVHIEWGWVRREVLLAIRRELLNYDYVYSTNYDLLIYWAMAMNDFRGFVDYFWGDGGAFDITDTHVRGRRTKVPWLHGGLHLIRYPDGITTKRRKSMFSLLEKFRTNYRDGAIPLFISEGSSKAKLASIYRSEYLSFAYSTFGEHEDPLVVFGHNLGQQDRHLVDKMKDWGKRDIAIGIYRTAQTTPETIISKKVRFRRLLPQARLTFYNSTTHPLASRDLRCRRLG